MLTALGRPVAHLPDVTIAVQVETGLLLRPVDELRAHAGVGFRLGLGLGITE